MKIYIKKITFSAATVISLAWTAQVQAAATVYEGFNEYTIGANLDGQSGGMGFSGAWTVGDSYKDTVTIVGGLSFGPNLLTSSNAVEFTGWTSGSWGVPGCVSAPVATPLVGTYWQSYLFKINVRGNVFDTVGVGAGTTADGLSSSGNALLATRYGDSSLPAVRTGGSDNAFGSTGLAVGTTYLGLAEYNSAGGIYKVWIFNQSAFDAWVIAGSSVANLSTYAIDSGSQSAPSGFGDAVNIGGYTIDGTPVDITFDEIRFGATLTDVTPPVPVSNPVPKSIQLAVAITFPTTIGLAYKVESTPNLTPPVTWTTIASGIGNGNTNTVFDIASPSSKFYQVLSQ